MRSRLAKTNAVIKQCPLVRTNEKLQRISTQSEESLVGAHGCAPLLARTGFLAANVCVADVSSDRWLDATEFARA